MEDFVFAVDVKLEEKFVKKLWMFWQRRVSLFQRLAGTLLALIEKLVDTCSVAAGGLLKRTFQTVDEVSTAKRFKFKCYSGTSQVVSQGSQQMTNTHVSLLGQEASAGAVARAITAGLETAYVESNLKTVAVHGLPLNLHCTNRWRQTTMLPKSPVHSVPR